jgi:hypothetical protein
MRTRAPAQETCERISSTIGGSGAVAAYVIAGSAPMATATGTLRPHFAACARPCLCRCQCIPVVRSS